MKIKTLVIIVAVLAVLSAGAYFLTKPQAKPTDDPRVGQTLASTEQVEKATKLTVQDQGKSVIVTKQPSGTWVVSNYHDFPADFSKLSSLIGELTSAKVEQFVTARPEKLSRLEFKDTKITLADSTDKTVLALTLGKTAEAGGRFIKFGDEPKGYRAAYNAWLDPEPKNWADASLVSVKLEDVAKVEVNFTGEPAVLASRPKKEEPFVAENTPAGQKLKADKISSILSSLSNLRFSDTSEISDPNAVAAKEHSRSVKLTTFDGKTIAVQLGRKPEQKIVKPPAAKADGTTGPAALGKVSDLAKSAEATAKSDQAKPGDPVAPSADAAKSDATATPGSNAPKPVGVTADPKLSEPETETIPAGPVYASVQHSDAAAPVNTIMSKRAFQIYDWAFTSLPQKREEMFEAALPPAPPSPPAAAASEPAKSETPKK